MNTDFPKVQLPDVTDDQREVVEEYNTRRTHAEQQSVLMYFAMLRLGKKVAKRGNPKRKARRTTKHVRHMARIAARSTKAVTA